MYDYRPRVCVSFFYGSASHLDLHSFPTRRSSDLLKILNSVPGPLGSSQSPKCLAMILQKQLYSWTSAKLARSRSEEHTSELQSHSDLVCRLLLEKKKNKKS